MVAKIGTVLEVAIPEDIAAQFAGVQAFNVTTDGKAITLQPVRIPTDPLRSIQEKLASRGITEEDIEDAVAWARTPEGMASVSEEELAASMRMVGTRRK